MDSSIPVTEEQRKGVTDSDSRYYRGLMRRITFRKWERELRQKTRGHVWIWEILEQVDDEFVKNNYSADLELDVQNESLTETAEAPSGLILPLLRYQKEWLAWSLNQENSRLYRGGILADEMGMGKTVQAIALVLAKRKLQKHSSSSVKGTLVVCPTVAANQWCREIEACTTEGSNKTLVYHGPNREKLMHNLAEYDFVITTYSTIEADYRPKQSKKHIKKSKPRVEMLDQKTDSTENLSGDDSVNNSARRKSVLHSVKWDRIILDEAHYIKSLGSNTTKAVLAFESSYKWALTGTPLQNRIGELYSLVRFLQVMPYAYYFCEDCDCRQLDFSFSNGCQQCSHQRGRHFSWWEKNIQKPLQTKRHKSVGRDAMVLLKHKILKGLMLRRTKKERAVDLSLPPKFVSIRKDSLDASEYDYYKLLHSNSRSQLDRYVQAGTLRNNYCHIFAMISRLRQAANHPYLVMYSELANGSKESGDVEQSCGLCQDAVEDPIVATCGHVFCKACLTDLAENEKCPSCTKPLRFDSTINNDKGDSTSKPTVKGFRSSSILNKIQLDEFKTSTKIEALREEIVLMLERDGSAKGIVFSQFISFLDLIQHSLNHSDFKCVRLVGSMSIAARDDAVNMFTEDPECRIMLMSLKAGAVALNLTVASHVFIMDPWWNPAVEQQAQDRIHRIGQHKPVWIVRFVIENTIEEDMLELQEKKKLLFEGTVGDSPEALGKLTMQDLTDLFYRHF